MSTKPPVRAHMTRSEGWGAAFATEGPRVQIPSPPPYTNPCTDFIEGFVQVSVDVEGGLDRVVAEPRLQQLWVRVHGDEQSRMRMPHVVEPARIANGGLDGRA